MNRPQPNEYNPYYEKYISLIAQGDVSATLAGQADELRATLQHLPEEKGTFAYEPGKWSIKEVLSHILDGERIFAYRLLRISRGDATPIEGFEQDDYIANSHANERTFASLLDEFDLQRRSNLLMIEKLDDTDLQRMGTASESPVSARVIAYILAGHLDHHLTIIKDRYLS